MNPVSVSNVTQVSQTVRDFIIENYLFGEDQPFADDQSFLQTNLIDSTGILELVHFLEQTFDITVEDEEMVPENLDSLSNVTHFIVRKSGV